MVHAGLSPDELLVLKILVSENREGRVVDIKYLQERLGEEGVEYSHEKVRLIVDGLWRKGYIFVDVKGRRRVLTPHPILFCEESLKNGEIRTYDPLKCGKPMVKILFGKIGCGDERYIVISEYRHKTSWELINNIIIPESIFRQLIQTIVEEVS